MKKILKEEKVKSAVFSIGGTVLVYGKEALIAVKDPEGEGYAATVKCRDRVLSTSGGYERYFTENGKKLFSPYRPGDGLSGRERHRERDGRFGERLFVRLALDSVFRYG